MSEPGVIPRRVPLVRTAVFRHVPMERWQRVVDRMVDLASGETKQAVAAAAFLASHCPAPDELDAEDTAGALTRITGPEQVDEWSEALARKFGMPLGLLIATLHSMRQTQAQAGLTTPAALDVKPEEPKP